MGAFQWNTCFITGLREVDEQHHRLVDLINRFGELIMESGGATDASLESVFSELADYSRYHFKEEEAMMVAEHLDPHDVAEHKKIHACWCVPKYTPSARNELPRTFSPYILTSSSNSDERSG